MGHYCRSIDDTYRVQGLLTHYIEYVRGYDLKKEYPHIKYSHEVIHYALHKVLEVNGMTLMEIM